MIHGHSSRLEEGEKLGEALLESGSYTLISMDLPCNGYASMFDHTEIASDSNTNSLAWFPLLDLIEQFVIDFIIAVGAQAGSPIEHQTAAVIGGSLGGNTSIRLAKRNMNDHPWLNNFIAWSAASVWDPLDNIIIEGGPNTARARMKEDEIPKRRKEYIEQVFDHSDLEVLVYPQGYYWYRYGWEPCKTLYLIGAKVDRREIYNEFFRRWHYRVALEQMLFSHKEPTSRLNTLQGRLLLLSGEVDDYPWTHIYDSTRDMAMLAVNTPGTLMCLKNTGHSIHDERPLHLAYEINTFLPNLKPVSFADENWTGWTSLGANSISKPIVAMQEDGRLSVFILGENNKLATTSQFAVNGTWSNYWNQFSAGLDDGDAFGTSIAVERNWDGRLEVFSLLTNHNWVTHAWQNRANGSTFQWDKGNHINQLIGGGTNSVFAVERFGEAPVSINENGLRFDIGKRWLLVGTIREGGRIHIRGQNDFGWWTDGKDIGDSGLTIIGIPFATRLASGLVIIIARNSSNGVLCIRETSPDNWQPNWEELYGLTASSDASATLDADGGLMISIRDEMGRLATKREDVLSGVWGTWIIEEAQIADNASPVLIRNAWGEIQVFVRWIDGTIRTKCQTLGGIRRWTDWNDLGGTAIMGPSVGLASNGMPSVFHVGVDNLVYVNSISIVETREITSLIRVEGAITHLCNNNEPWSPIPVSEVINDILGHDRIYILRTPSGLSNQIIVRQILTTVSDSTSENNLRSLPVIVDPSFGGSESVIPVGTSSFRVTHTIRHSDHPFAAIRGILGDLPLEGNWSILKSTAIGQLQAGTHQFHIENEEGVRNAIVQRVFLSTAFDQIIENNLDVLPDYVP